MSTLDTTLLGVEVKDMCRRVAQAPQGAFHFRMGQQVAERLSYPPEPLRRITFRAVESFAGVGQVQNAGRLAIADIVSETQLTEAIVYNADLWAACIGGAGVKSISLLAVAPHE